MSNILDALKKIDRNKITYPPLAELLDKALSNYKNKNDLFPKEKENYTKLYQLIKEHFPEAAGIKKAPEMPKIDGADLLNTLKANKVSK